MKLRVSHHTRYEYAQEVTFSPHILYMRPREDTLHRLQSFSINVSPSAKLLPVLDPHDNLLTWAHFWDRASELNVRTEFVIETLDANPFDFILKSYAVPFPFGYEPVFDFALGPYLAPPYDETQAVLRNWLDEHFVERPSETVPFLLALNTLVYTSLTYQRREEDNIQSSAQTLALGSGSCRDYAVLFVELCRTLGLAARFVSGYLYAPPDDNHRSAGAMHAWAEVYLPGAGWKGIDPTHGIFCGDTFIPVAHAAQATSVNPIQGSFYSPTPTRATLQTRVLVDALS